MLYKNKEVLKCHFLNELTLGLSSKLFFLFFNNNSRISIRNSANARLSTMPNML